MSGGRFDYQQYRFTEYIDDIQNEINNSGKKKDKAEYFENDYYNTYTEDTLEEFKNAVEILKKAQIYMQRIDWFLSGDDGEESFHKRLKKDLCKIK